MALTFLQGIVVSAKAHPLHQASAEAHYNASAKTLEVSMALYVNDLESALTQRAGRPVTMEKTPAKELDGMLMELLQDTFVLTSPEVSPLILTWVGRQMETPSAPSPSTSPSTSPPAVQAADAVPSHETNTAPAIPASAPSEPRLLLFFQFQLTGDPEAHRVKISTLTDLFPDQKNLIQIHAGPRRAALAFSPSSLAKPIVFTAPPAHPPVPAAPTAPVPPAPPTGRER